MGQLGLVLDVRGLHGTLLPAIINSPAYAKLETKTTHMGLRVAGPNISVAGPHTSENLLKNLHFTVGNEVKLQKLLHYLNVNNNFSTDQNWRHLSHQNCIYRVIT